MTVMVVLAIDSDVFHSVTIYEREEMKHGRE